MVFRIIRRSPWIALGAVAAYYMDGDNGRARREEAKERLRDMSARMKDEMKQRSGELGASSGDALDPDAPLAPSVPSDLVASRSDEPLAEEASAGIRGGTNPDMAEQILEESEWRVTDRAGTSDEHRRSEETVEPVSGRPTS